MNLNLYHPSSCLIVGGSQCGKTSLVRKMIRERKYGNAVKKVKWCYSYVSPWFTEEPEYEFIHGLPDDFENGDLLVIDDLMHRLNEKIANLFTGACHHCGVSVILILQNMFPKIKVMRDISLNAHYIALFKNSRDVSQIGCLARQIYPRNSQYLTSAYIKATEKPYGYLVIDLHPKTPEALRLKDSFFPSENGIYYIFQAQ